MADSKTRFLPSHIPVKSSSSRPAQGASTNTLSTPHLGLVPPSRHLSVGDSPSHPIQSPTPPASSSSGLSSFRSIRNFLPFGPSKLPNPTTSSTPASKNGPFSNLGSIRKSMNGERSVSAPQLRPSKVQEDTPLPVFSIELSHKVNEPLLKPEDLRGGLGLYTRPPEPKPPEPPLPQSAPATSQVFPQAAVVSSVSPKPAGISDLSTIIESETSGISKYAPNLDDSRDLERRINGKGPKTSDPSPSVLCVPELQRSPLLVPPSTHSESRLSPVSQDTLVLDLSTSKVTNEVLEALANDQQSGWLNGHIVVDETEGPVVGDLDDPNASFQLGSLDPELAALLSPNRIISSNTGLLLRSVDTLAPLPTTPPLTESHLASPTASLYTPLPHDSKTPSINTNTSPVLTTRSVGSQSSPVRRPTPLSRSTSASAVPSPHPSFARTPSGQPKSLLPSPAIQMPTERASDIGERPLPSSLKRRVLPQMTPEGNGPRRPSSGGDGAEPRRPALSRLLTPVRPALQLAAATSRSALRNGKSSPSAWDGESVSPSRPPSSLASARPSLDGGATGGGVGADRFRNNHHSRDRSASVSERPSAYYGRPGAADWLGPRTAKAFAAAGLIDGDREKDGSQLISPPGSRFGTMRNHGTGANGTIVNGDRDRESRSQYAPSRMGFSEAGSGSSWGRRSGSISRTGAMSEVTGALSESVSTPRTTFSTGSTALTSVSGNSASASVQHHLQSELQNMQDRHALETGALLNALADSQRSCKTLRQENSELRERVHDLEGRLADAIGEIQRLQYQVSLQQQQQQTVPPSSFSRAGGANFQRQAGLRPPESLAIRRQASERFRASRTNLKEDPVVSEGDDDDDDTANLRMHVAHLVPSSSTHLRSQSPSYTPSASTSRNGSSEHLPRRSIGGEDNRVLPPPQPKRFSGTSSIFPIPPSSMSMLLHEEGLGALESFSAHSPPSPTAKLSKHPFHHPHPHSHSHQFHHYPYPQISHSRSASGNTVLSIGTTETAMTTGSGPAGNISPTTANFSMLTGSPGSLNLRPEHERLLGDMPPLNLSSDDYELDGDLN